MAPSRATSLPILHRALTLVVGASMLAACAGNPVNQPQYGVSPIKALSAVPQRLTHDIRLDASGRPGPAEEQALADFLTAIRAGYGDDIAVETGGNAAASDTIAAVVGRFGLALSRVAPPTGAELTPGTVRLVVSRSLVQLPACPDWSKRSNPNFGNASLSNLGCANRTNLGLMVADPADLQRGRALESPDAKTINRGLEWLREYKSKGFENMPAQTTSGSGGGDSGGGSGGGSSQ